ncbi:hypothetical protein ACRQ1B_28175 [Rhizobium panacihumi]|uniref:hypothetical protein n=1 Tax=Rhizobium panacihumi TaxID=2008450 RepID=UPI003D79B1B1
MEWEIQPFIGMGPLRFGMFPAEVAAIVGPPESVDEDDEYLREYRAVELPIVSYENNVVTEIEAFYDVENVIFRGRRVFDEPGLAILQFFEQETHGARVNAGTVLFKDIGITAGRLDEGVRGDHSVTAFAQGLWDDRLARFKDITFV